MATATLPENVNLFTVTPGASYPSTLQIETTSRCNLKCPNCRRTIETPDAAGSHSSETLEKIQALIPHVDQIAISGWGESLMGRSLGPILNTARQSKVTVSVTTNGTLLTERKCRNLIERNVQHIVVSADAGTPEGYEKLRPGGVPFAKVLEGVRRLGRLRDEAGQTQPHIYLAMVYTDDSAEELAPLVRLAADLPVASVILQVLYFSDFTPDASDYRLSQRSIDLLDEGQKLGVELRVPIAIDMAEQMRLDTLGQIDRRHSKDKDDELFHFPSRDEIKRHHLLPTCFAPWENPFIDAEGEVFPCCVYPTSYGNLKDQSFQEIWQGEKFVRMRRDLLMGDIPEPCLHCRKTLWYRDDHSGQPGSVVKMEERGFVGMGWNEKQKTRWKTTYRWTRDVSDVHLGNSGENYLFIEGAAPRGQTMEVHVNGNSVGPIDFGPRWEVKTLPIDRYEGETLHVSLRSRRPVRDSIAIRGRWPGRLLGAAVAQVGLCGSPDDVERINPAGRLFSRNWRVLYHVLKSLWTHRSRTIEPVPSNGR